MKLYKLTDKNSQTHNGSMTWEVGKSNSVKSCDDPQLCTGDVIHAYKDVTLALLLNLIHANIEEPLLYECEGKIEVEGWDKCGVFKLKVIKKLRYPKWYKTQKSKVQIQFAILCAESVLHIFETKYPDDKRTKMAIETANKYMTDNNINTVADAYAAAAYAAADAYADAYADADAHDAADAYADADADADAYAYAYAAAAADAYACAAACAAADAYAKDIDFCKLADMAVKMIMEADHE